MSDAQAAPVTESGVPPATQDSVFEEASPFKVFVGNLAYSTTDEGLRTFFAPVQSDIISAQVILRGTRSAGYGFVAVSSPEAAQKAVETLNGEELDTRKVIVEIAKPSEQKDKEKKEKKAKRRPGRRGGKAVPGEVTEAEANGDVKTDDALATALGTDEAAKPKKKKKKASRKPKRKAAPADGETAREAGEEAPAAEDATDAAPRRQPRARKPRAPRAPRPVGEDPVGEPSKTMLFVANLGFNVDDEGLSALFTEAGINVVSARIVRRRWGHPRRSKGYGFVDVGSEEEQKKALEAVDGKDVGGRPIAVKVAALKQSRIKNEQNRLKSRRQREQESREEGLSTSLFERAEEDKDGGESKALGIMMKMGFKIGQSLGMTDDSPPKETAPLPGPSVDTDDGTRDFSPSSETAGVSRKSMHRVEPLPLNEWSGKRGIGLGKRARSPGASDRLAKMAKMAEDASKENFRDRSRREYEEKRAEARLAPAQRTCLTLDEKAGITFNILWLNPNDADSIPKGLTDALSEYTQLISPISVLGRSTEATRLRDQMRADALRPISDDEDDDALIENSKEPTTAQHKDFTPEAVEEAAYYLRLGPGDRLSLVLTYLRDQHAYCFWCGTQYEDERALKENCPGAEEDDHD
ncbi:hypothetical protein BU15DRAFT_38624 [Melanogaster broomeanus]|nr:hypothetical protein BU15DRAFT_38624 [Melanogaster broomeanus]